MLGGSSKFPSKEPKLPYSNFESKVLFSAFFSTAKMFVVVKKGVFFLL